MSWKDWQDRLMILCRLLRDAEKRWKFDKSDAASENKKYQIRQWRQHMDKEKECEK